MNYSNSQRAGVILYLAASLFGGYYDSRNYSFDRRYNIRDGKLHVEETRKTSWADSREERKWVADEKETHDFLYKHKDDLDLDGLE